MTEGEFRVVWRREHDRQKRTRIYQTIEGATNFAEFLRTQSWDEIDDLQKLGNPVEVTVEFRHVGEWTPNGEES